MGLKHAKFDRFDNLRGVLVCDLAGWIAKWMFLPWSWVRWTGEDCSVDWWVPFRKKSPPRMVQSTSLIRFGWPPVRCGRPEVEITKVIEKGAALGVNFRNLREVNEAGWSVPDEEEEIERLRAEWNLEEEITKAEPILGRITGVTSGPGLYLTGSVTSLTVLHTWWPRCLGLAKLAKPKRKK
ncbi:hypothetical protein LWI29_008875 [Acer saccharum]|uniref:Uncharacterized protein n=1 Tax=Acer saccharum TaxID=4024 RepID=A0AA39VVY6_ACESA|nr:hypothetical protein LWI29_008875 [Acer saccharum]